MRPQKGEEEDFEQMLGLLKTETAGYLEGEGVEKTYRISQDEISKAVSLQSSKKHFELKLTDSGSYNIDYTRDGRHLLIAGRRGHVAAIEWECGRLRCELQLDDTVRAAKWLQNETFFAVAQTNYVYVYDTDGSEVHRLGKHAEVDFLEYLPYHFLLASIGNKGMLRYQDMTTGQIVAEHHSKYGRCRSMRQNPGNGIMHLGHSGGYVTLWAPSMGGPLVTMQCHSSPVEAIAFDPQGNYMATSGLDGRIRVWDMRTYKKLHEYFPIRPATTLDISQRGVLAAGNGPHVTMWKDCLGRRVKEPYMHHLQPGCTISSVRFCPYDDVLGTGHSQGVSSLIVPGAGEPNYDSYEANPFSTRNQRREATVKQLLDKLQPETIMLDPTAIGSIAKTDDERRRLRDELEGHRPERKRKADKAAKERAKRRENIIEREKRDGEIVTNFEHRAIPEKKSALDRFKLKSL
ncbi:hypothetical protein PSACC_03490 [Paramicrosporidium saccamoebae]|uniref:U three protein 7 n=1 Tax=Paramicrosporidium saccamoebae TaxID=1246581 RepID=A0A2H9TG10_9FUNG|nr:hypothetical protein PSACC_03490 [Paramicrosporidium saccamoebae]